jgi:phosphate transport system substrate-binding protein
MGDEADVRQDDNTTNSSDDNQLLQGISGNQYAIGFFGYAYYVNNQDQVQIVEIENPETGECVAPSDETVQDGTYAPLSRPLFIYSNNNSVRENPQVAEFLRYYFGEDGAPAVMVDVGYSLPPEGTFETNLELVEQILAGENPEGTNR